MTRELPHAEQIYARYLELRRYVGWEKEDAARVRRAGRWVAPRLPELVDDFYREIERHQETQQIISGGAAQLERLKDTLTNWLHELFDAHYDRGYVLRRWHVGWRHVEIGLRQAFVNAALSRLRCGILHIVDEHLTETVSTDHGERFAIERAVHRALDLDLALIQDAYEAEKHLRSEAVFHSLVKTFCCAIVILRDDHSIAYFNPFAEQITGHDAADVIGENYIDTMLPDRDRASVTAKLRGVAKRSSTVEFEHQIVCRDGSRRTLVWNAGRLEDFDGAPAVFAVGHDITDLQRAQQRALQSQRLATIGQTMTGLAHESRNAFQRIQACLEVLQLEIDDRPEALELVQRMQRALDHLHQLNEEVRSYAAPIRLERQPCDLSRIWRDTWEDLAVARHEKSVAFREGAGCGDTTCNADRFALSQLFRNILENAIAACPSEGVVDVCVEPGRLADGRPALEIVFRDNGPGVTAEIRENIFEPFFTTKTKGTGLGMAIAKRIIDAHEGEISVDNSPHGGAEVRLRLPRP